MHPVLDWAGSACKDFQFKVGELANNCSKAAESLTKAAGNFAEDRTQELLQLVQHDHRPRLMRPSLFASVSTASSRQASKDQDRVYPGLRARKGSNPSVGGLAEESAGVSDNRGTGTASSSATPPEEDEPILISEVEVRGVDGKLFKVAQEALTIKPNFAYTLKEVQDDMQRVFDTGYFQMCRPYAEDTRDGVKLTIEVAANPELSGVIATGANLLPQIVIQDAFKDQYGKTLNFGSMHSAIGKLNTWYEDRGIFGQVTGVQMKGSEVEVKLAEMVVGGLNLKFFDRKSNDPVEHPATRPEVILRQLCTKPGQVYSARQAKRDIDAVYSMGLFDDVNIVPAAAEDSTPENPRVDLTLNLKERKTGGLSAGGGISAQGHGEGALPGFIGSCSYSQRNLFGLNQKLSATVEVGQVDFLFRINHTDPWVRGDKARTSRTVNLQNTRTSGNAIHGRAPDEIGAPGSSQGSGEGNVIVARMTGGIEYGRPLASGWSGNLGVNWQRSSCLNEHGQPLTEDMYGGPLTYSGGRADTMSLGLIRMVYSGQADTQLVVSMEQALALRPNWLNFNRFRVQGERTLPFGAYKFTMWGRGGMILGDLPPYEAFPIGGTNSVRGYSEGGVGSGRNYIAGSAEIRRPLFSPVEGVLFFDYGSDLDSGQTVRGDPAGRRGKPGTGYGYGAGIRVDSPVGPLRLEYAFNDKGLRRFHVGIGSHG